MSKCLGKTELIIINSLRSNECFDNMEPAVEGQGLKFTFKQICLMCKDLLTKEQVHCALGRLVRRGTVWKTNGIRPQRYWVLLVVTRRIGLNFLPSVDPY